MLNQQYTTMLQQKDIIFEIFGYSQQRMKEIGAENVYDFSLGNPSVPTPDAVNDAIVNCVQTLEPLALHGYSPAGGIPEVRNLITEDLNRRYGMTYQSKNIFMTCGAASALAHAFRVVTNPGDTILGFSPYFPEYIPYTAGAGLQLRIVPADTDTFQIDFAALERMLSPDIAAVLINSPNNPSGIVYSTETVCRLSEVLTEKSKAFGHPIFLISDEPYRDIVFKGVDNPYIADFYPDTITCYSFSKSISLPGERIGYLAVNPTSVYADQIIALCQQVSRTTGHNGAASLMQRAVASVCNLTSNISVYETNKQLLFNALTEYGYSCVEPGGTFYMFPRALENDAKAFCKRAMELDLMLVPGDNFGCPGHFRIAYCVPTERVEKALPIFKKLAELYHIK